MGLKSSSAPYKLCEDRQVIYLVEDQIREEDKVSRKVTRHEPGKKKLRFAFAKG